MESLTIKQIFNSSKACVVSMGGGAIMEEENLNLIRQNCLVIWLWISAQGALRRIDYRTRPLLENSDPMKKIENLLTQRKSLYAKASDLVINSEVGTASNTVRRIKYEMDKTFKN
jgi:shikimate kinase